MSDKKLPATTKALWIEITNHVDSEQPFPESLQKFMDDNDFEVDVQAASLSGYIDFKAATFNKWHDEHGMNSDEIFLKVRYPSVEIDDKFYMLITPEVQPMPRYDIISSSSNNTHYDVMNLDEDLMGFEINEIEDLAQNLHKTLISELDQFRSLELGPVMTESQLKAIDNGFKNTNIEVIPFSSNNPDGPKVLSRETITTAPDLDKTNTDLLLAQFSMDEFQFKGRQLQETFYMIRPDTETLKDDQLRLYKDAANFIDQGIYPNGELESKQSRHDKKNDLEP